MTSSIRPDLVMAMQYLRTARQATADPTEREAIADVMYSLNRAMKRTSDMDIPVQKESE